MSPYSYPLPSYLLRSLFAALCLLLFGGTAVRAGSTVSHYHVTQQLGGLSGNCYLELQLSDGSQSGDGNSLATLSNVQFGALSDPTTAFSFGSVLGSLNTALTLSDSDPTTLGLADFTQPFSVDPALSGTLSFDLTLASSGADINQPDGFFLFLRDSKGVLLPTTGPAGIEFLDAEFTTGGTNVQGFSSVVGASPYVPAPEITPVPEASTLISFSFGISVIGLSWFSCRLLRKTNCPH